MTFNSKDLIEALIQQTKENLEEATSYQGLNLGLLNWKANAESWSMLECLAHLNLYGDFYIPEITEKMKIANSSSPRTDFKSGILGNYFAKSMLPKEKLNKMKTFTNMNPVGSQLDKSTVTEFIAQQNKMLDLLETAKSIDLQKIKTSISISSWIKLRLGDTFRVVVYHNYRHVLQAQRALQAANMAS